MMFTRTLKCVGFASLLATPVVAQFGLNKDKKGSSFEDLNEMAKNQLGDDMPDFANMDMEQMMQTMQDAMSNPDLLESMGGMDQQMMDELTSMDPDKLIEKMQEGLSMLTAPDMMEQIMGQKEDVMANLKAQGLVDDETLDRYENDPEFFQEEMAKAFDQMKDIFSDPQALSAATEMMKGFGNMMANPEEAMKELGNMFAEDLSDDDKIEEARLQLLSNPDKAGNPAIAQMFENLEMQEILKDPVKWREQVKMGQGMLLKGDNDGNGGAGMGEL
mmetsp:Transcript_14806/g.14262  ORF Transcript_14806/g.14262 Transcript_14806/m.14262 type:complete len:274 (-) Transcript_14806:195-1016(-)